MKELKDYLHLYLGCPIWDFYNKKQGVLFGINNSGVNNVKVLHGDDVFNLRYTSVKPILRSFSDLTEEDCQTIATSMDVITDIAFAWGQAGVKGQLIGFKRQVNFVNELRKLFFDCDELVEAGLAINKTTIKT